MLSEKNLNPFKEAFQGQLIQPGEPEYEEGRKVWNGMIDKRPALIARCTGAADVIEAVNFAREHEFVTAVRDGGHNVAGFATCDGGLVIDLSPMKGIHVDVVERKARAQGGVIWQEFDHETQAFSGWQQPAGWSVRPVSQA